MERRPETFPVNQPYGGTIPSVPYTVRVDDVYIRRLDEFVSILCWEAADHSVEEMMRAAYQSYPMVPERMAHSIAAAIKRHQTMTAGMRMYDGDLAPNDGTALAEEAAMDSGTASPTWGAVTGSDAATSLIASTASNRRPSGDLSRPYKPPVAPNVEEDDDEEDLYSVDEDVCDALLASPEPVEMPSYNTETLPCSWMLEAPSGFQ